MANRNKFEEMLERLVNEDRAGAEELFHEIVVERSREIYETLLAEEAEDEDLEETTDEEVDESEEDLDESEDEDLDESDDEDLDESEEDLDENFFDEAGDDMMGGDMGDDMTMDIEMPGDEGDMDMGMDDEGEGDVEDRVADLEDELEALKAEFEALMADEAGEEEHGDMDFGGDEDEGEEDEEGDDEDEGEEEAPAPFESKQPKSAGEQMREYVEKATAKMGDNGANTKSAVAGANNMGGTTANIAKGGDGGKGGTQGGLANPATKEDNAGNVNVPGAKGATKLAAQPGHGAEKKGKPETADKSAGSPLNGAPKRAK